MLLIKLLSFFILLFLTVLSLIILPYYALLLSPSNYLPFTLSLALIISPFIMLIFYGLIYRSLTVPLQGTHTLTPSLFFKWGLKRSLYGVYSVFFQKILFVCEPLQFLILRVFQAKLHPSSYVTTFTRIFEPYLISLGKKVFIGEYTNLATSILPNPKTLVTGPIIIEDYAMISGLVNIGPDVHIGEKAFIKQRAQLFNDIRIGKEAVVGFSSTIYSHVTIGEKAVIGRFCQIYPRIQVPPHTEIPDNTVIKTQEELNKFIKN